MDIIQAILGGVAAAFVAGVVQIIILKMNRNAAQEDAHDQIKNALKILLYDRLKYLSKRSIEKGRIAIDDLEDLIAMHKIYYDDCGISARAKTPKPIAKSLKTWYN